MKFTKLIMLASVVSLACACEKRDARRDCARAGSGEKKRAVSTQMLSFSSIEEMGAANQRTGKLWMKWP